MGRSLAIKIGHVAKGHDRRVTLNLLRLSSMCPAELRWSLDKLASLGWDFDALDRLDYERIFGHVTEPLAKSAAAEFEADPSSIIDHRSCDAECKLCGQRHIRFEFLLRNKAGGRDVWTGSDCIIQYGLAVDGGGTAEEALKRLQLAIRNAISKAYRDDWQAAHPDHAERMAECERLVQIASAYLPRKLYAHLQSYYSRHAITAAKKIKAAVKYYRRCGCLTEKRTENVWLALPQVNDLLTEYAAADKIAAACALVWGRVLERTDLTYAESDCARRHQYACSNPRRIAKYERDVLARIIADPAFAGAFATAPSAA